MPAGPHRAGLILSKKGKKEKREKGKKGKREKEGGHNAEYIVSYLSIYICNFMYYVVVYYILHLAAV